MSEFRSIGVNTNRVRSRSIHTQTLPNDMSQNETIENDRLEGEHANVSLHELTVTQNPHERVPKPLHLTSMAPRTPSYSSTPLGTHKKPRQSKLISIEITSASIGKGRGRGKINSIEREMRRTETHLMAKSLHQQRASSSNLIALPENVSSMQSIPRKKSDSHHSIDGERSLMYTSIFDKMPTSGTQRLKRSRSTTSPKSQNTSKRSKSKIETHLSFNVSDDDRSNHEIPSSQIKTVASQPIAHRKPSKSSIVITKIAPTTARPIAISSIQNIDDNAKIRYATIDEDDDHEAIEAMHNQNRTADNRQLNRSKKNKHTHIKRHPIEIKPYYDPISDRIIPRRSERLRLKRLREEQLRLQQQQQKLLKDKSEPLRKKRRNYKRKNFKQLLQNIDLGFVTLRKNNEGYKKQQKMIRKWREE
jgi:hypothetical protein